MLCETQGCKGSYVLYLRSFFMQKSYVKDNENIVPQTLAKLCCYNYERDEGMCNVRGKPDFDVEQP